MRFVDLFAGIGGFSLGLERAGMHCVGQVEIDDYCNLVLEKHWPDVKRIRDIRDVRGDEFGSVGLVCGGFPCQPFSCAGKQKGEKDNRYLWPEMLRVIKAIRPRWVLGENVAGIIGVELDKVYSSLEEAGYDFPRDRGGKPVCFCVSACAVDAPHRRDRVWIIAHTRSTELRDEPGRRSRKGRQGTTGPGNDGAPRVVADTKRSKRDGRADKQGRQAQRGNASGGDGPDVADTAQQLFDGPRQTGERRGYEPAADSSSDVSDPGCRSSERQRDGKREEQGQAWREPVASMGVLVDGLSPGLVRWSEEPEIPRVTTGEKGRIHKLRALGNAVVPQVVTEIGKIIMAVDAKAQEA